MGVLALCLCICERVLLQGAGQEHWLIGLCGRSSTEDVLPVHVGNGAAVLAVCM